MPVAGYHSRWFLGWCTPFLKYIKMHRLTLQVGHRAIHIGVIK